MSGVRLRETSIRESIAALEKDRRLLYVLYIPRTTAGDNLSGLETEREEQLAVLLSAD